MFFFFYEISYVGLNMHLIKKSNLGISGKRK